ncbi:chromosomal replication initiator protein DnaA [Acidaminobacterium chupaoyuni]
MYTPASLLEGVIRILERDHTPVVVSTWFSDAKAVTIKDGTFILLTSSDLKRESILRRFTEPFCAAITELTGEHMGLKVLSGQQELTTWRAANEDSVYASYTFERFIVGSCNKFAHAAAYAVAQNPAGAYNPLFIYGQSGLGKTHLLYAIAGALSQSRPGFRIVYIKGDDFTNELVAAIQRGDVTSFREKYRRADLLLIDDIQFIAGKTSTQEEFFHTFNTLHESGKQIVMTSDRPPKEILTLEDRLKTRFEWGLLADIQPPDFETRMALVNSKAEIMGVKLPPDVVEYIASSITNNVRQLEGAVKKILAKNRLMNTEIDMDLAEECIKDILRVNPGLRPTPELILEETASFYNASADRIMGKSKTQDVVMPRQVTMYLMRDMTDLSYPEIGRFMHRDHTTVIHAEAKVKELLAKDQTFAAAVADLKKNIKNR